MREFPTAHEPKRKHLLAFAVLGMAAMALASGMFAFFVKNRESETAFKQATNDIRVLNEKNKALSAEINMIREESALREASIKKSSVESKIAGDALAQDLERSRANESNLRAAMESLNKQLGKANQKITALSKAIGSDKLREIESANDDRSGGLPLIESEKERFERLLNQKFTLISDEFTRPKVYIHNLFKSKGATHEASKAEKHLATLSIKADGRINDAEFSKIQVLHNDDVHSFNNHRDLYVFVRSVVSELRTKPLKCRLFWEAYEFDNPSNPLGMLGASKGIRRVPRLEEFTLEVDHANALIETFEMADALAGK